MRKPLPLIIFVVAILGVAGYFVASKKAALMTGKAHEVGAPAKLTALSDQHRFTLEAEARKIGYRLNSELERRLAGVVDENRQDVLKQFHADFADELARSQEIEDTLVEATPNLLKEDNVFLDEEQRIRTVADFIRAGHSVEEAERMAQEEKSKWIE